MLGSTIVVRSLRCTAFLEVCAYRNTRLIITLDGEVAYRKSIGLRPGCRPVFAHAVRGVPAVPRGRTGPQRTLQMYGLQ